MRRKRIEEWDKSMIRRRTRASTTEEPPQQKMFMVSDIAAQDIGLSTTKELKKLFRR